jgi:demethylmenaquinone methyltransferase/2-methoxy-6-polyprenyl-1,4-benzoquinol methylase
MARVVTREARVRATRATRTGIARAAGCEPEATTHFGFDSVPLGEKQGRVNDVFHKVASRYDLMNDLMSAGLHRLWKDALVAWLRPPRGRRPYRHLDVAGGTGDVAFRILDAAGANAHVTVLDINGDMLEVGRARAAKRRFTGGIDFVEANAESLPFPDGTRDGYTIAFGIRNVPRIEVALGEAFRVLRPGGRFLCLEFAPVDLPVLDRLYDAYSFAVIPRLGEAVTGDRDSYQYLVESIRRFPRPEAFATMIRNAGFRRVEVRPMTGGIVNIHSGWKL